MSHSQARDLHPHFALWSPVSPKSVRFASFPLLPAVPVPGTFEHPGCRKKEGISERLHWVRKNAREWEGCGCFTEGGSKKIRSLSQCHSSCILRADVGFASVGVGCCGHNVDQRGRICSDH